MSVLVSHPTGNANVRSVVHALEQSGRLDAFWTTVALPSALTRSSLLPKKWRRRLGQRSFSEVPWAKTRIHPWREVVRLGSGRLGVEALRRHEVGWASVDGVYRHLDSLVANHLRSNACRTSIVYCYEDGALESFRAAKDSGCECIYDLPTAYWKTVRRILEEESVLKPEWIGTMQGISDSKDKLDRKENEVLLAGKITVASTFTKTSIEKEFEGRKVQVIPYGCPTPRHFYPEKKQKSEPLRLLYAGRLTQPKGIAYLVQCLALLTIDWRITVAGARPLHAPAELDRFLEDPRVSYLGTVPHATLLDAMDNAHAFVFPSLVEGFGMVITEALSAGLPVITTPHTAGPDLLTDGVDGYLVPIRSPEALADRITRLADDEDHRRAMAHAALSTARHRSWEQYEAQIVDLVTDCNCPAGA